MPFVFCIFLNCLCLPALEVSADQVWDVYGSDEAEALRHSANVDDGHDVYADQFNHHFNCLCVG